MKKKLIAFVLISSLLAGCSSESDDKTLTELQNDNKETIVLSDFRLGKVTERNVGTLNGIYTVKEDGYMSITLKEPGLIYSIFSGDKKLYNTPKEKVVSGQTYSYSHALMTNNKGIYTLTFTLKDEKGHVIDQTIRTFNEKDIALHK